MLARQDADPYRPVDLGDHVERFAERLDVAALADRDRAAVIATDVKTAQRWEAVPAVEDVALVVGLPCDQGEPGAVVVDPARWGIDEPFDVAGARRGPG